MFFLLLDYIRQERKRSSVMGRWIYVCLIFLIFLFYHVNMMIFTDQYDLIKRHLGSARENRYRAQQRTGHNPSKQHTSLSPELIRARWLELYNEQNQT